MVLLPPPLLTFVNGLLHARHSDLSTLRVSTHLILKAALGSGCCHSLYFMGKEIKSQAA